MNVTIEAYARNKIKEGLVKLPEGWQMRFKQLYANGKLDIAIVDLVDSLPAEKLDWALTQVENSIKKSPPCTTNRKEANEPIYLHGYSTDSY
jgi:hypothetical protein